MQFVHCFCLYLSRLSGWASQGAAGPQMKLDGIGWPWNQQGLVSVDWALKSAGRASEPAGRPGRGNGEKNLTKRSMVRAGNQLMG